MFFFNLEWNFFLKNKNLFIFKKPKTPGFEKNKKPRWAGFLIKLFLLNPFYLSIFFVTFPYRTMWNKSPHFTTGADPRGAIWAIAPPKTYESNIFHHGFVQFRKTLDCQQRLDCQILLKSPPPKLTSWIRPCFTLSLIGCALHT